MLPADDVSINMMGNCVEAYGTIIMVSGLIQKLQRLILFCNNYTFQFQPAVIVAAMESLNAKRKSKQSSYSTFNKNSFVDKMRAFQHEAIKCWRGNQKGAKLIILPLSLDDKTIDKGDKKVVLLLFVMFGLLKPIPQEGATEKNIN